jgi:hypothetical protein
MKRNALWLLLFIGLTLLAWAAWQQQQPKAFHLYVVNNSDKLVDQVRLFGSGVLAEAAITNLLAGQSATMAVTLGNAGGLNFEVSQGFNRIDTFIKQDVSSLQQFQQQLIIHNNNRYILND